MNRGFNVSYQRSHHYHRLKFDSDYDLQKANEQFQHALKKAIGDVEKLKVDNQKESNGLANSEASKEQKIKVEPSEENSKTTNDEGKSTENLDSTATGLFYDKTKSFFDHISCETREKIEGTNVRPDWRKERIINQETFGSIAVRSQQALYRSNIVTRPGFQRNSPVSNNSNPPVYNRNIGSNIPSSMTYYRSNPTMMNSGYNNNRNDMFNNNNIRESPLHSRYGKPTLSNYGSPLFNRTNYNNRKLNMPNYGRYNAFNRNDNSSVFRNVNSPMFARNVKW